MKTKYYAIVHQDKSGPAYGTGTSEEAAWDDAHGYGFEGHTSGVAVEITASSYRRVQEGNPDAVEEVDA